LIRMGYQVLFWLFCERIFYLWQNLRYSSKEKNKIKSQAVDWSTSKVFSNKMLVLMRVRAAVFYSCCTKISKPVMSKTLLFVNRME
jgi:hypothetical protein